MKATLLLTLAAVAFAAPAPQMNGGQSGGMAGEDTGVTLTCTVAASEAKEGNATADAQCAQVQSQLADGIQANLDIQAQELKGIQTLQNISASDFASEQQSVLDIQNQGIKIRANNQILAAEINSPAQDGLAIVAMAQVLEVSQVMSLKGAEDAMDQMTLGMLVQEVMDGTKQNQKNLEAAQGQTC